ncbi:MAG: sigma factor-like helix-turn-helix DNA-binding protein [Aliidongia sp.]
MGRELGVSKERVRQLESRALLKLRVFDEPPDRLALRPCCRTRKTGSRDTATCG